MTPKCPPKWMQKPIWTCMAQAAVVVAKKLSSRPQSSGPSECRSARSDGFARLTSSTRNTIARNVASSWGPRPTSSCTSTSSTRSELRRLRLPHPPRTRRRLMWPKAVSLVPNPFPLIIDSLGTSWASISTKGPTGANCARWASWPLSTSNVTSKGTTRRRSRQSPNPSTLPCPPPRSPPSRPAPSSPTPTGPCSTAWSSSATTGRPNRWRKLTRSKAKSKWKGRDFEPRGTR